MIVPEFKCGCHMRRFLVAIFLMVTVCGSWSGRQAEPALRSFAAATEADAHVRWPLDLKHRFLTSNFMEYREGRFHAGLDLKTQSRTGFAVRAVEDGYISRLRTATGGYGRAVYLHGDSGRTYVFAHLERFNDQLRALVSSAQTTRSSYSVNLNLAPGSVRVARGDVLGLSGQSGTPGPHLHFEVRDIAQRPISPEGCGFAVPDSFPPAIFKIRVMPGTADSRVQGGLLACSLENAEGLQGRLPAVTVRGPVAFSARMIDAADIRAHRLEPHLIVVRVDGREVFTARNTSYAFAQNSLERLEWLEIGQVRERWLFKRPMNRLQDRLGGLWSLEEDALTPGRHQVSLTAADHSGNRTEVQWELVVLDAAQAFVPAADSGWQPDPVGIAVPNGAAPDSCWSLTPFLLVSPDGQRAVSASAAWPDLPPGAMQKQLRPESGHPVLAPTSLLILPTQIDEEPAALRRRQGLVGQGAAAWYLAGDWPIESGIDVPLPGAVAEQGWPADVGIYRLGRKDTWEFIDYPQPPAAPDSTWTFPLSKPGLYAVFSDIGRPFLGESRRSIELRPRNERNRHGVALSRWPLVEIPLMDAGSGIDPNSILIWLDGRRVIGEPDLPRDRLLIELPDSLAPGSHVLGIDVTDWAGRSSSRTVQIQCSLPAR